MSNKKFRKGDIVRETGERQTGIVISFTKKEQHGPAKFPGGLVKIRYVKRNKSDKMQGAYLVPAIAVKKA